MHGHPPSSMVTLPPVHISSSRLSPLASQDILLVGDTDEIPHPTVLPVVRVSDHSMSVT